MRSITVPLPEGLSIAAGEWFNSNMNAVDTLVLALIAMADLALIAYLRQRRARALKQRRMDRCLTWAVRRELANLPAPRPRARWTARPVSVVV